MNSNGSRVLRYGFVTPLAPSGTFVVGTTTVRCEGPLPIRLNSYTPGSSAPAPGVLRGAGRLLVSGDQLPENDPFYGEDLGAVFGTVASNDAAASQPSAAIAGLICGVNTADWSPKEGTTARAGSTHPAVSSNVTVTVDDATDYAAYSPGDTLFISGLVYSFVAASGGVGGTITATNTGVAASKVDWES